MGLDSIRFCFATIGMGIWLSCNAEPPQILYVFPDFATEAPSVMTHIITGENFDSAKTEVWAWDAGNDGGAVSNAVRSLSDFEPELPKSPPKDAQRMWPLDVERQIITTPLTGEIVWVRTASGLSKPYLLNVAEPRWISDQQVEPGATVHIFGFGLRFSWRPCRIALKSTTQDYVIEPWIPSRDYRAVDSTLIYFDIPTNSLPGQYVVFVHNGMGGSLGWRMAGQIEIISPVNRAEKLFNVRDFGANGREDKNDYSAITNAIGTAKAAMSERIRPIVFFPPGKYRTDTTLSVPSGVTLRGASRDLTLIEGFGVLPSNLKSTALIHAASHSTLESLSFQGFTVKGPPEHWDALITASPNKRQEALEDFTLQNCRLYGEDSRSFNTRSMYRHVLRLPFFEGAGVLNNEMWGSVSLGDLSHPGYRLEFIGNTIHGGGNGGNVSFEAFGLFNSVVDGTQLRDAAARFLIDARRHCAIRFNEVHDDSRAIWENAEETFLVHGALARSAGCRISATFWTLKDGTKQWLPSQWRDAEVVILAGCGFGQHRAVKDNTSDTLLLDSPWRVAPDDTSEYVVGEFFVGNSWYANLNDTPGRTSLWFDCIENVIEKHRDVFSGGIDACGAILPGPDRKADLNSSLKQEYGPLFMPAWYNIVHDSWLDGTFVKLWTGDVPQSAFHGPPQFANFIVANHIRESYMARTGFATTPHIDAGIWIGNRSAPTPRRPTNHISLSHIVVADNSIASTPHGISVADSAWKTFILANQFDDVAIPILDWGGGTVQQDNKLYRLDEQGEHIVPLSKHQ